MTDKTIEYDDVLLPGAPTADGKGQYVLRSRKGEGGKRVLEAGVAVPVEEGKPILYEMVELEPIPNSPLRRVKSVIRGPLAHKGPARISSKAFLDGWERIFGNSKDDELVN